MLAASHLTRALQLARLRKLPVPQYNTATTWDSDPNLVGG